MNNWMDELVSISYMVLGGGKGCVTLQTMMPLPLWFFEPTWSENVSCVTSYNICFSQYYGGWKSRCIVMKLEITKRTVILSSRKKVRKGSSTQFLLFVSLLQSSFPLTTELEGSLIVFFGTNTFFCFTQKNSFLYGRRGQTGRYQADIHCCILACCLHNNAILSLV